MQNPQRQSNHLQVLAARRGANIPRPCPHIKHNRPLQPRNQEMRALIHNLLLDTGHPVEDYGPRSALDIVERRLHDRGPDGGGHNPAEERRRYGGHGGCGRRGWSGCCGSGRWDEELREAVMDR